MFTTLKKASCETRRGFVIVAEERSLRGTTKPGTSRWLRPFAERTYLFALATIWTRISLSF
jgi:hypothetical protein